MSSGTDDNMLDNDSSDAEKKEQEKVEARKKERGKGKGSAELMLGTYAQLCLLNI